MNWSLVPPQMVGFLLFLILGAGSLLAFGLGIFWVLYQLNKSRNADLDNQIRRVAQDENRSLEQRLTALQTTQEAPHRETMTLLGEMEKRLPTRDSVSEHDSRPPASVPRRLPSLWLLVETSGNVFDSRKGLHTK